MPWLQEENQHEPIDLSTVKLTHYRLESLEERRLRLGEGEGDYKLTPPTEVGKGQPIEPEAARISELVEQLNKIFEGTLTDADLLGYANHISGKMLENERLAQQASINSKEQFALGDFHDVLMDNVIEGLDNYQSMAGQVMGNEETRKAFSKFILDLVYQEFQKKQPNKTQEPSNV